MATYSARDVAFELRKRLPGLPVKKMHKLLYYCQGWHGATFNVPLFREAISAWDMGPVVGQLWWSEGQGLTPLVDGPVALDEAALNTVGFVLSRYGDLSGQDLERLTHSEPPWIGADALRPPHGSSKISFESMVAFFASPADEEQSVTLVLDPDEVAEWLKDLDGGVPGGDYKPDSPERFDALLSR